MKIFDEIKKIPVPCVIGAAIGISVVRGIQLRRERETTRQMEESLEQTKQMAKQAIRQAEEKQIKKFDEIIERYKQDSEKEVDQFKRHCETLIHRAEAET